MGSYDAREIACTIKPYFKGFFDVRELLVFYKVFLYSPNTPFQDSEGKNSETKATDSQGVALFIALETEAASAET